MKKRPQLVVHGGAWEIPDSEVEAHCEGLNHSLTQGWACLNQNGSAVDAVEIAVSLMEDDPTFDAGKGSILNTDGSIEMDASIMDGATMDAGGVAALRNFPNPVQIARKVMEETEHVLLAGQGCVNFALQMGFKPVPIKELLTERELKRLESLIKDKKFEAPYAFGKKRGTVGAVAMDSRGHVAAATSTGGTPKKIPGRVGDTPLIGCGTYAEDGVGGVSCTGWGEAIIKVMLARMVSEHLRAEKTSQQATELSIAHLATQADGLGGVICLDAKGTIGIHYNTPRMARGWVDNQDQFHVEVL